MNIFVTDTETTGLPSEDGKAVMIEFAGCLYNVETRTELAMASCLLYHHENPVQHINGISPESLACMNPSDQSAFKVQGYARAYTQSMWNMADYVLAHNAPFDRHFLEPVFGSAKPWRCSKNDLKFPKTKNSKGLSYIAVDHGIYPFAAHRGLNDVLTLVALLKLVPDLADQMNQTVEETTRWEATDLPYEKKDLAKERGFRFDGTKKVWWKELKASETTSLPFRVQKA